MPLAAAVPGVPGRENFGRQLPSVGHLQSLVPWLLSKKKPPTGPLPLADQNDQNDHKFSYE